VKGNTYKKISPFIIMEKQEIQKQISDAVRIFEQALEKTYLDKNKELYGIGVHSFQGLLCGKISVSRLKSGNLRISGEIGKEAINKDCDGLPRTLKDWDIYPLVITLFNKDFDETKQ
jgi:hypothetical protein